MNYDIEIETVSNESPGGLYRPTDNDNNRIQKSWGYEILYHNTNEYCAKSLIFLENKQCHATSMHLHVNKRETLICVEGSFKIEYIVDKKIKSCVLHKQDSFTVPRGLPHRIIHWSGPVGVIIEASTLDTPSDSIRIG